MSACCEKHGNAEVVVCFECYQDEIAEARTAALREAAEVMHGAAYDYENNYGDGQSLHPIAREIARDLRRRATRLDSLADQPAETRHEDRA